MRRSIHRNAMKYCAMLDITAGQLYEESIIMFMDLNPVTGLDIVVERPSRATPSVVDKLSSLVCLQELSKLVLVLKQNHEEGRENHQNLLKKLKKTLSKYERIKHPTKELVGLVDEVFIYVGK